MDEITSCWSSETLCRIHNQCTMHTALQGLDVRGAVKCLGLKESLIIYQ